MQIVVLATIGFIVWAVRVTIGLRRVTQIDGEVLRRTGLSFVLTVGSFAAVGVLLMALFS